MAVFTLWNQNGEVLYENPKACFMVMKHATNSRTGSVGGLPTMQGRQLRAVIYGEATRVISGTTVQSNGAVVNGHTMVTFSAGVMSWNIPNNARIGPYFPPYNTAKFTIFVMAV